MSFTNGAKKSEDLRELGSSHKMVPVTVNYAVNDNCDSAPVWGAFSF